MLEILKLLEDNYQDNINYELYQLFVKYFFQELEERLGKKITTKEELETLFNLPLISILRALILYFEDKKVEEYLAINPEHEFLFNIYLNHAEAFCDKYNIPNKKNAFARTLKNA